MFAKKQKSKKRGGRKGLAPPKGIMGDLFRVLSRCQAIYQNRARKTQSFYQYACGAWRGVR